MGSFIYDFRKEGGMGVIKFWAISQIVMDSF